MHNWRQPSLIFLRHLTLMPPIKFWVARSVVTSTFKSFFESSPRVRTYYPDILTDMTLATGEEVETWVSYKEYLPDGPDQKMYEILVIERFLERSARLSETLSMRLLNYASILHNNEKIPLKMQIFGGHSAWYFIIRVYFNLWTLDKRKFLPPMEKDSVTNRKGYFKEIAR